jgi:uncharacterized protein (DUF2141 family)
MTHALKFTATCILVIAISITLTQCSSPNESKEIETDSIAAPDSATTAATDTVSLRVPLTLIVNNLESSTAPVVVGVYKSNRKFLYKEGRIKEYKFTPNGKILTATITDLKYGEYAIAIYQDVNSSGKIDKNMIGIPTEGYAFSNNFKPKVKAPAFSDCMFVYDLSANTITMNLIQ